MVNENFEPFIIDFSNAYDIINHTWDTELMMRQKFSWDDSYKSFVNYDYINWGNGLKLDEKFAPEDEIPITEEYYDIRFSSDTDQYYIYGGCESFASELRNRIGGIIVGIYNGDISNNNVPFHYLVYQNDKYIDGTGIYRNAEMLLKVMFLIFGDELEVDNNESFSIVEVDQVTLNNEDMSCEITDELEDYLDYVVNYIAETQL